MIQLYIEDQLIDQSNAIDYSITKTFIDANDVSKLCDTYSKTIKIPMTDRNRELFSHWELPMTRYSAASDHHWFSPYKLFTYKLLDAGTLISSGTIRFVKCDYSYAKDNFYEISLTGEANPIMNLISTTDAWDLLNIVYPKTDYSSDIKSVADIETYNLIRQKDVNPSFSNVEKSLKVFPTACANWYQNLNSNEFYNFNNNLTYTTDVDLPILSTKEFRIDKLPVFKSTKYIFNELKMLTKGNLILDPLFFNSENPYYNDTWTQLPPISAEGIANSFETIDSGTITMNLVNNPGTQFISAGAIGHYPGGLDPNVGPKIQFNGLEHVTATEDGNSTILSYTEGPGFLNAIDLLGDNISLKLPLFWWYDLKPGKYPTTQTDMAQWTYAPFYLGADFKGTSPIFNPSTITMQVAIADDSCVGFEIETSSFDAADVESTPITRGVVLYTRDESSAADIYNLFREQYPAVSIYITSPIDLTFVLNPYGDNPLVHYNNLSDTRAYYWLDGNNRVVEFSARRWEDSDPIFLKDSLVKSNKIRVKASNFVWYGPLRETAQIPLDNRYVTGSYYYPLSADPNIMPNGAGVLSVKFTVNATGGTYNRDASILSFINKPKLGWIPTTAINPDPIDNTSARLMFHPHYLSMLTAEQASIYGWDYYKNSATTSNPSTTPEVSLTTASVSTLSNSLSSLKYFEWLKNYCRKFNLKFDTKDQYLILTTNDRLLGYDPLSDSYNTTIDSGAVRIDHSTISYEPNYLDSAYKLLNYTESSNIVDQRYIATKERNYGAYKEKSPNIFANNSDPLFTDQASTAICTTTQCIANPTYAPTGEASERKIFLTDPRKVPIEILNLNDSDGKMLDFDTTMIFEGDNLEIPNAFKSKSTDQQMLDNVYQYYYKGGSISTDGTYARVDPGNRILASSPVERLETPAGKFDVHFDVPPFVYAGSHDLTGYKGIKDLCWKYLDEFYNETTRIAKCKGLVDLTKFRFSDLVSIEKTPFLVLSIDNWKSPDTLCDLTLISVEDIKNYYNYTPKYEDDYLSLEPESYMECNVGDSISFTYASRDIDPDVPVYIEAWIEVDGEWLIIGDNGDDGAIVTHQIYQDITNIEVPFPLDTLDRFISHDDNVVYNHLQVRCWNDKDVAGRENPRKEADLYLRINPRPLGNI